MQFESLKEKYHQEYNMKEKEVSDIKLSSDKRFGELNVTRSLHTVSTGCCASNKTQGQGKWTTKTPAWPPGNPEAQQTASRRNK